MISNSIDELARDKLTILYIIQNSIEIHDEKSLTNYVLENDLMNYFSLRQYVAELIEAKLLHLTDNKNYYLSEQGKTTLNLLISNIPEERLSELNSIVEESIASPMEKLAEISAKPNGEFIVKLMLSKELDDTFTLKFTVASLKMATIIKEYWENSSNYLYNEIMEIVSNVKED